MGRSAKNASIVLLSNVEAQKERYFAGIRYRSEGGREEM